MKEQMKNASAALVIMAVLMAVLAVLTNYVVGAEVQAPPVLNVNEPGVVIAKGVTHMIVVPKASTSLVPVSAVPPPGTLVYTFSAPAGYYYLVGLTWQDGVADQVECEIVVEGPEPDPKPKPKPDPDPPPPPRTATKLWIIWEQYDRTADQVAVLQDPRWRTAAKAAGVSWEWFDDDGGIRVNRTKAATEAARKHGLPAVVLLDKDSQIVEVRGLPDLVGMRALVEELGQPNADKSD